MKKKVMCMLLTGMMAASMIAGCGNSGNASANAGADTNTDASADAADSSADQSADVTPDTTAANSASAATGDFDNSEYINVVSREDGSGTRGAFIELFGVEEKNDAGEKIDNTTDEAIITNSTDVMLTTVSGDEYSIGYVSLGSLNDSVKAVSIDGAEATVDNIKSGDYTIARPFNIATKGTPSDVAQDFINFIMSADGQAVISDNKYIPVDDGAAAFESNGASGKVVVAGSSSVTPVMEKLKEAYVAVNSGAEIEIQESDSTTGMTAAMDGTCDIGMASRELKDSETEGGLTAAVIAMDGIAVEFLIIKHQVKTGRDSYSAGLYINNVHNFLSVWRKIMNHIKEKVMEGVFLFTAVISIIAVALICVFLFANGFPAMQKIGVWQFLSGKVWKPTNNIFGIFPMILGSIYVTGGALLIGVPVGILMSIFMARFCPEKLYRILKPIVDLLAGIPSIVYGFFGLVVLVPFIREHFKGNGNSILTASILLGIMILPTIIGVSESAIRAVENSYYEGALALGATHERSVFTVIVPAAKSGIMAAVVLGVGRAIGETMAVMMVAGNQARVPSSIFKGVRTLTANIVMEMGYATDLHREALIATGVVLFVFILIINVSFSILKRRTKDN